jgi:ABC-2 type transport system ATP-binding protein
MSNVVLGARDEPTPATGGEAAAVLVQGLRKTSGELVAVDDASLAVTEGEIFGILGPNGAGRTTAVECVIGLRIPDAGTVRVLGPDPRKDLEAFLAAVGVQLQASALPGQLSVGEFTSTHVVYALGPGELSLSKPSP